MSEIQSLPKADGDRVSKRAGHFRGLGGSPPEKRAPSLVLVQQPAGVCTAQPHGSPSWALGTCFNPGAVWGSCAELNSTLLDSLPSLGPSTVALSQLGLEGEQ